MADQNAPLAMRVLGWRSARHRPDRPRRCASAAARGMASLIGHGLRQHPAAADTVPFRRKRPLPAT